MHHAVLLDYPMFPKISLLLICFTNRGSGSRVTYLF